MNGQREREKRIEKRVAYRTYAFRVLSRLSNLSNCNKSNNRRYKIILKRFVYIFTRHTHTHTHTHRSKIRVSLFVCSSIRKNKTNRNFEANKLIIVYHVSYMDEEMATQEGTCVTAFLHRARSRTNIRIEI